MDRKCYPSISATGIVGRRVALADEMSEIQYFPLDEYRADEGVARLKFAVFRFRYGKHVKSVIADAHTSVGAPLQSDDIAGLQGACAKKFAVDVVAAYGVVCYGAAKHLPVNEPDVIAQDV